jgi:hypothetical protein
MHRRLLWIALAATSCGGDFDRSVALVTSPRILAVKAEPPESAPGAAVAYTALVATPGGTDPQAGVAWSFCSTPASPTEGSPLAETCIAAPEAPVAFGFAATLSTPADACRRFGPQGMPAQAGQSAPRPAAPDVTGGYYQPLVLDWQGYATAAFERLTCDPIGVSLDLAQLYRNTRRPNQNPRLLGLTATIDGQAADLTALAPESIVELTASWSPESVESYVMVDPQQAKLVSRTEDLWVAWFVSGGALDADVSRAAGSEAAASNRFHASASPGTFYLWAVLHDDRGGTDYAELPVIVR